MFPEDTEIANLPLAVIDAVAAVAPLLLYLLNRSSPGLILSILIVTGTTSRLAPLALVPGSCTIVGKVAPPLFKTAALAGINCNEKATSKSKEINFLIPIVSPFLFCFFTLFFIEKFFIPTIANITGLV